MMRDRHSTSGLGLEKGFFAFSSGPGEEVKPVPTGSMNTRSVKLSQVPGLSIGVAGSDGLSPSAPNCTRLGPMAPRFKYPDAAPGPPFRAKVTGRLTPGTV